MQRSETWMWEQRIEKNDFYGDSITVYFNILPKIVQTSSYTPVTVQEKTLRMFRKRRCCEVVTTFGFGRHGHLFEFYSLVMSVSSDLHIHTAGNSAAESRVSKSRSTAEQTPSVVFQ